eukprot:TRINITY_DN67139_c3_g1_i2.p1 TRINITY_DN67139_c3_g1~~TRINITY_DN67139_c3_g1_i2.p1  ORF type:complete len:137 (+),score=5.25 TRINITY_DN67139_c3_g1_i2:45-413(+)
MEGYSGVPVHLPSDNYDDGATPDYSAMDDKYSYVVTGGGEWTHYFARVPFSGRPVTFPTYCEGSAPACDYVKFSPDLIGPNFLAVIDGVAYTTHNRNRFYCRLVMVRSSLHAAKSLARCGSR